MIVEKNIEQINLTQLLIRLEKADAHEKEHLLAEIQRRKLSDEELNRAKKQYAYYKRMKEEQENKPLHWFFKVACIVVPFSAYTLINGNHKHLNERDLQMVYSGNNIRERREIMEYSVGGIIIYFLLFIVFLITIAIKSLL
ncbi:hypothetical protein KDU71_15700 [Carboxylicivirga sediminis]|uniref:Uncharacterized protein n=1 Tax=Carboxylicivirga sediminis TaxID=2006564 RepID=A0A941IXP5_9BACT|nr:hypothetical protein [Carboxylicivirga sediminis]MBR8537016.1 hypothetical protein [Carboxylicivirga sediminis]